MSVFYLKDKRLFSVDAMNNPRDFLHGKKLILSGATLDIKLLSDSAVAILDTEIILE